MTNIISDTWISEDFTGQLQLWALCDLPGWIGYISENWLSLSGLAVDAIKHCQRHWILISFNFSLSQWALLFQSKNYNELNKKMKQIDSVRRHTTCIIVDVRISYKGMLYSSFFQIVQLQPCTSTAICHLLEIWVAPLKKWLPSPNTAVRHHSQIRTYSPSSCKACYKAEWFSHIYQLKLKSLLLISVNITELPSFPVWRFVNTGKKKKGHHTADESRKKIVIKADCFLRDIIEYNPSITLCWTLGMGVKISVWINK